MQLDEPPCRFFHLRMTASNPFTMADESAPKPEWKHPDEVMQLHRLKVRKRALQARMNRTAPVDSEALKWNGGMDKTKNHAGSGVSQKRKNPFATRETTKKTKEDTSSEIDASNDSVLFELMHSKDTRKADNEKLPVTAASTNLAISFESVLTKLERQEDTAVMEEIEIPKGEEYLPIDWTLKTKMRIMSPKPFAWNGKLKTSEEASGTTGFVRCLDIGEKGTTLDTSPNARFHQCCLVWQHPSLPWLDLFPRAAGKVSASLASNSTIAHNQYVKDALFGEWNESFRSLFHLLRARQCPYFYVCTNNFTVLYRAAGICGISEVHALLTPTTRGFRTSLKQADIEYTMPLSKDSGKRRSDVTDSGCETLDSCLSDPTLSEELPQDEEANEDDDDSEEQWLQSLGIEDSEIRRINTQQARLVLEKESEVDTLKQSLIFVKGVEAQALFNFLINCKSAIATTGALAGVPPTLLAPVAFHGASLRPIKVRESVVRVEKDRFYSLELKGPLLPHVIPSLCNLMRSSQLDQFSVSCAQLESTTSFSIAKHGQEESKPAEPEKVPQSVFGQENLSDCGFDDQLLSHFCSPDPEHIQVLETLKFSNERYTWS